MSFSRRFAVVVAVLPCTTISVGFGSYPDPTSGNPFQLLRDNVLVRPF